jgi:hypothetical protein
MDTNEIIDKKGIEFEIELLDVTPHTGELTYLYSERDNGGNTGSIYDQPSLMRVLSQKSEIITDKIIDEFYSSNSSELAYILKYSSIEQLVCLVNISEFKPESFGRVVSILKRNKDKLIEKCRQSKPQSNLSAQTYQTGVRAFPRYDTQNLNTQINIIGITNKIKLLDASVGGISIETPTPSNIIETSKKIQINFSRFKYEFLVSVAWTYTSSERVTSAGLQLDFQKKQDLSNWQTFIYALYIKQKR